MNPKLFKAMRVKQKRAVNPDIPRPNLFTHEKKLKDVAQAAASTGETIAQMQRRIAYLERTLRSTTNYLAQLHQHISRKK